MILIWIRLKMEESFHKTSYVIEPTKETKSCHSTTEPLPNLQKDGDSAIQGNESDTWIWWTHNLSIKYSHARQCIWPMIIQLVNKISQARNQTHDYTVCQTSTAMQGRELDPWLHSLSIKYSHSMQRITPMITQLVNKISHARQGIRPMIT